MFSGTVRDKHKEIGNAVPPPMSRAIGLEIRKALIKSSQVNKEEVGGDAMPYITL